MTPDPILIAYEQYSGAKLWAEFAAAVLPGIVASGGGRFGTAENAADAAKYADALLAEFRARFHHPRPESP